MLLFFLSKKYGHVGSYFVDKIIKNVMAIINFKLDAWLIRYQDLKLEHLPRTQCMKACWSEDFRTSDYACSLACSVRKKNDARRALHDRTLRTMAACGVTRGHVLPIREGYNLTGCNNPASINTGTGTSAGEPARPAAADGVRRRRKRLHQGFRVRSVWGLIS